MLNDDGNQYPYTMLTAKTEFFAMNLRATQFAMVMLYLQHYYESYITITNDKDEGNILYTQNVERCSHKQSQEHT